MCYNCGCHNSYDDMGHPNNITEETFIHMAEHAGKSVEQIKSDVYHLLEKELKDNKKIKEDPHLTEMFEKAAKAWGQSIDEARKNTFNLLKNDVQNV
jgi:hypothetical protein